MSRGWTVCNEPGCPDLVPTGKNRCPAHAPKPWAGSTRGKATASPAWRKLRARILKRDGGRCYICGGPGADTVDHILSVANGGTDDPSNLASVHDRNAPHCHRTKTATVDRRGRR